MQSTQIQNWVTIAGALGTGTAIGTVLSYFLTSRLQRRNWINDNRKLEWRELIDELHGCMLPMGYAFRWTGSSRSLEERAAERTEISRAVLRGSQVIRNRLFIADVLKKHGIAERWNNLSEMTDTSDADLPAKARAFLDEFAALENDVLTLSRRDLGVDS